MAFESFRPERDRLPNDVDASLEHEIDERVAKTDWQGNGRQRLAVVMTADRALKGDPRKEMNDRRIEAQKQVAEEIDTIKDLQAVQRHCGERLVEVENAQLKGYQEKFTELLEEIEESRSQ